MCMRVSTYVCMIGECDMTAGLMVWLKIPIARSDVLFERDWLLTTNPNSAFDSTVTSHMYSPSSVFNCKGLKAS